MPRARRTRSSQPSPRAQRGTPRRTQTLDIVQFERALRDALRVELARPVSKLVDSLETLADRLGEGAWGREAERSGLTGNLEVSPEEIVEVLTQATGQPATTAAAPQADTRACAVIGCRNPPRSLGYCAAHYQKRRLMIASNRLHPMWVENASPHSVPDVIPPRGPRGERRKAESPTAAAKPTIEPRMFVRKKGQAAPDKGGEAAAAPQQSEQEAVAAIVGKWAQEFQARRGQS